MNKLSTKAHSVVNAFFANQLSSETRRAYKSDLQDFTTWTAGVPLNQINIGHLIAYREALMNCYSTATVVRRLAAVRAFFRHLVHYQLITHDPTAGVKLPSKPDNANTEALSDSEVIQMLESCDQSSQGRWEYALVSVLAHLGLRRSEVCSLTVDSLGSDRGVTTLTVFGKGGKERVLPLPDNVANAITCTRNTPRAKVNRKQLLVRPDGKTLKADHIYYIVRKITQRTHISKTITPHSFRATFVSNAIDQGCNPMQVQYACGWSDTKQITRYDKRRHEIHKSAVWKVNYETKG